jgi:hypothetical protein
VGDDAFLGFACVVGDRCVVRHDSAVDACDLPRGLCVPSTFRLCPGADLARIPTVRADETEFPERVVRTKNSPVVGYERLQNAFRAAVAGGGRTAHASLSRVPRPALAAPSGDTPGRPAGFRWRVRGRWRRRPGARQREVLEEERRQHSAAGDARLAVDGDGLLARARLADRACPRADAKAASGSRKCTSSSRT